MSNYIISIYGNCGSGKTTLSKALSKELKINNLEFIGKYRKKLKIKNPADDILAWIEMSKNLLKNSKIIYVSTGLNMREEIIDMVFQYNNIPRYKILLKCPYNEIQYRLENRDKQDSKYFPYKETSFSDINKLDRKRNINDYHLVMDTSVLDIKDEVDIIKIMINNNEELMHG